MAHWNEKRAARWVEMMRGCNVPQSEDLIRRYEESGDLIYFSQFIELMRANEELKKHLRGSAPWSS